MSAWFSRLNLLAVCLCFGLVVLGAFVRLSNAGLGCPDWPGCYGQITVPQVSQDVSRAEAAFPQRLVEAPKAWKEMLHRYLAGIVGLLILTLAVLAWRERKGPRALATAVLLVLITQIIFGALTVTLQVNPLIVTTHLMLGLTTLALLWWMYLGSLRSRENSASVPAAPRGLRVLAAFGLGALAVQIFLGGWTSTNYAALACPDFPTCLGSFAPATSLARAFTLWHGHDLNYEYGILDTAARATVHLVHRYGALTIGLILGGLAIYLLTRLQPLWRRLGAALLAALLLQITIGIGLINLQFPLWLADAHNAGAALLLLTVVALNFFAHQRAE